MALALVGLTLSGLFLGLSVGRLRERLPWSHSGAVQIQSIAVLPFENLSRDPDQEYYADAMTDELITNLGKIRALRVISRTSVMSYKGTRKLLAQVGRELNVEGVVEGTVLRSGDRVRIDAQLVQVNPEKHLWAETYDRDLRDVLGLQEDVARDIAREIRIKLTPLELARLCPSRQSGGSGGLPERSLSLEQKDGAGLGEEYRIFQSGHTEGLEQRAGLRGTG